MSMKQRILLHLSAILAGWFAGDFIYYLIHGTSIVARALGIAQ